MNTDCYSILGVPPAATAEEIRAAYRRLARQYHPDLNSGPEAEARMKEINEAYDTLSDPLRRRQYDIHKSNGDFLANRARRGNLPVVAAPQQAPPGRGRMSPSAERT